MNDLEKLCPKFLQTPNAAGIIAFLFNDFMTLEERNAVPGVVAQEIGRYMHDKGYSVVFSRFYKQFEEKPAQAEPDLLDLKLPIAIRVGGGIFGKGVSLRTVANQLRRIQDTYGDDLKARMSKRSICRENETEGPAVAVDEQIDPLQGAVNWLYEAMPSLLISDIQSRLFLGYNRAKRLYDAAAEAAKKGGV